MEPTKKLRQAVSDYRAGTAEAFTAIYEGSCRYIYTCIHKVMVGNDNEQDIISDIMQDTYVEISRSIQKLDNEGSFLSWAGAIATRKCYAYLRKNKKCVLLEGEDTFENLADDDNIIPEEIMQDREKQRLVREIIDTQLTEMQRLCIVAYYYNEQKQSEIARELGLPENTVKTYLSRAKAKIRDGVLVTEKKQGIRLHTVAPLLAILFKEDVSACEIPEEVSQNVASALPRLAGKKGMAGKIASASVKAKIAAGTVAAAALCAIGGAVYMAAQPEAAASRNVANIQSESTENTLAESIDSESVEASTVEDSAVEIPDEEEMDTNIEEKLTYTEQGNLFLLENVVHHPEANIDMDALAYDGRSYKLVKSVTIYDTDNTLAGYTKEDFLVKVVVSNDEWSYCDFGPWTYNYLVKTDELMDAISEQDKETLVAASATQTSSPTPTKAPQPETPEVETPKVESASAVSEPVVGIPEVVEPVEGQPVVAESDKYTPEEVIAIYRSVMESNGITWDPSLKGNWDDTIGQFPVEEWYLHDDNYFGGSWGSGFLYLERGWIDENAYSNVEAAKLISTTSYYLEVTGSDENYVYITEWHN